MRAGQEFGGYRLLGLLGHGTSARVFLARQLTMDRVVALKVFMPKRGLASADLEERFVHEARVAAACSHPHIVAIHDAGILDSDEGRLPYFAMEHVDGGNLKELLVRDGACDEETVGRIMRQVGAALHYAADKGMVHRDVKPANIMLTADGTTKLADFGLVHQEADATEATVVGSPQYMSPEQAQGLAVDFRSDQYSLGCVLFHMLTGEGPYAGLRVREMLLAHIEDDPPDPADYGPCPSAWRELCLRLLAKDPAERFADPQGLSEAIADACRRGWTPDGDEDGEEEGPTRRRRPATRRKARRRPTPAQGRGRKRKVGRGRRAPRPAPAPAAAEPIDASSPTPAATPAAAVRFDDRSPTPAATPAVLPAGRPTGPRRPPMPPAPPAGPSPLEIAEAQARRESRLLPLLARLGRSLVTVGSFLLTQLVRLGALIVGLVVACLPVVKWVLYRLVQPAARLYFAYVAPTWRVVIHAGHQHYYLLDDDPGHGVVPVFANGRQLPLVWQMIDERWCGARGRPARDWIREMLGQFLVPIAQWDMRDARDRVEFLLPRSCRARGRAHGDAVLAADYHRAGQADSDAVLVAKYAGARLLPIACSATPAWIFTKSWNRLMIPAPFATVHLAFARPVPTGRGYPTEMLRRILQRELTELQEDLDAVIYGQ